MNKVLEELVIKYATHMDGWNDNDMIAQGAVFIDNTVKANTEVDKTEEEVANIASRTFRDIWKGAEMYAIQSVSGELNEEGTLVATSYRMVVDQIADGEVGLTVKSYADNLRTRKLNCKWTTEAKKEIDELSKKHKDIDIDNEFRDLMIYEIIAEVQREMNARVMDLAKKGEQTTWAYGSSVGEGSWEQEKFRTLYTCMLNSAENIARSTRRGAGNRCLVSPKACVALQCLPEFTSAKRDVLSPQEISSGVGVVGEINGTKIARDTFAYSTEGSGDFVVTTYKGSGPLDCGLICILHSLHFEKDGTLSFKYAINDEECEGYYEYIDVDLEIKKECEKTKSKGVDLEMIRFKLETINTLSPHVGIETDFQRKCEIVCCGLVKQIAEEFGMKDF